MAVDHDVLVEHLTRLQLTCIYDQLDSLLDEASEKQSDAATLGVCRIKPAGLAT